MDKIFNLTSKYTMNLFRNQAGKEKKIKLGDGNGVVSSFPFSDRDADCRHLPRKLAICN